MSRNEAERLPVLWDKSLIPKSPPPKWGRCPVCGGYWQWELRTCPTCEGVILLALYIGDFLPSRLRNS